MQYYRVLEPIKDNAAQELQPALTGLTAQSRNLAIQWLQDSVHVRSNPLNGAAGTINRIVLLNETGEKLNHYADCRVLAILVALE